MGHSWGLVIVMALIEVWPAHARLQARRGEAAGSKTPRSSPDDDALLLHYTQKKSETNGLSPPPKPSPNRRRFPGLGAGPGILLHACGWYRPFAAVTHINGYRRFTPQEYRYRKAEARLHFKFI